MGADEEMTNTEEDCPLCCEPYKPQHHDNDAQPSIHSRITCSAPTGCQSFSICRICVYRQSLHLATPFVYDDGTGDFCSIDPTACPQCKRAGAFREGELPPLSDEIKRAEIEETRKRRDGMIVRERERGLRCLRDAPPVVVYTFNPATTALETCPHPLLKRLQTPGGSSSWGQDSELDFSSFATVGVPDRFQTSGILYYEIDIMKQRPGFTLHFGLSLANGVELANGARYLEEFETIGDNCRSWGFNGVSGYKLHRGEFGDNRLTPKWGIGSVIGIAANLDTGMIAVSRDNNWNLEEGFGVKFEDSRIKSGVYPCISAIQCVLRFKFGGDDLKYGPPPVSIWDGWAKYEDFTWVGLSEEARSAALTLGYTQQSWMDDKINPVEYKSWDELSPEEQAACRILGYNKNIWTRLTSIWNKDEKKGNASDDDSDIASSSDDDESEQLCFTSINWTSLPHDARWAAESLGYAQQTWDLGGYSPFYNKMWSDLPHEQQRAAIILGYDEEYWDMNNFPSYDHLDWRELPDRARVSAEKLGYTECFWDSDLGCTLGEKKWENLNSGQRLAAFFLRFDKDCWNAGEYALIYSGDWIKWNELSDNSRQAAETLQFTQQTWDSNTCPLDNKLWDGLSHEQQTAANVLGFREKSWNRGKRSNFEHLSWDELPGQVLRAAETLGFTQQIWDSDLEGPFDNKMWSELTQEQKKAANVLGDNEDSWDNESCSNFDELDWNELPSSALSAALTLGYTHRSWNLDLGCPFDDKMWHELSEKQQTAADVLGDDEGSWNEEECNIGRLKWSELSVRARRAASMLAYTELLWNSKCGCRLGEKTWYELTREQKAAVFYFNLNLVVGTEASIH